ncbi:MAG: hypothetical protein LUG44_03800 [Clostridiales bacterium]|nr:hypothetical protein [Clostridiales bacterium]
MAAVEKILNKKIEKLKDEDYQNLSYATNQLRGSAGNLLQRYAQKREEENQGSSN